MPTPLRILILEDSPHDTELEIAVLESAGYTCRWERVESRSEFLACLNVPDYDVILADYNLPTFDGLAALRLFVERDLNIPFILVSGALGEEIAIESLKAGATDYVLKTRLSRLGPVVKRALHEKEEQRRLRQAEAALRKSEARFRGLAQTATNAIITINPAGYILTFNQAAEHIFNYPAEETIGKNITILIPEEYKEQHQAGLRRYRAGGPPTVVGQTVEMKGLRKGGEVFPLELSLSEVRLGDEISFTGIIRDITRRKQTEESLRQLNQAMEQSPVSVIITDTRGIIQYVNPKFTQVTGYSAGEVMGQNPRILQSGEQTPEFYRNLWNTISAGQEWRGEFHNKKKNGELYWEMASIAGVKDKSGKITHYVAVKEDVTHRKQMEKEAARQERLAAVGQLAAGIAHDFNNLLMTMMGNADLLQHWPDTPETVKLRLAKIVQQGERAANLTRQILDFSRQTINDPHPLDMRVYLNETLRFIERTIPETIQIQFNFGRGEYTINADPTQMQQVITNLAVNARDAMPRGGMLSFDLARISLAPDEAFPCPEMEAGEWVSLTVTDTGSGIAPEVLPHLFEPFFTTKEVGKGTGLGLAQIYGIVKQHYGCITANSQVGQGATFTLYFPALLLPIAARSQTVGAIPKGQNETILLVEDEQVVLEVTQAMLKALNYRVVTATDGDEAIHLYRTQADQIALVLTDTVMPGMGGLALASALRAEAPDIKVLLMSGYARDSEIAPEMISNITARLQKPLSIHQLAQVVREALI